MEFIDKKIRIDLFIIKGFAISTMFRPICPPACVGSRVQQTPEEGWRTYWLKRCGNNNKDEDNSPKTLNNKNHQALSQKFRQLIELILSSL